MPHYFFHVVDGGEFEDQTGRELANDAAVRHEAMRALARDATPNDSDEQGYTVLVTDEDGGPVYSATLSYLGTWLRDGG